MTDIKDNNGKVIFTGTHKQCDEFFKAEIQKNKDDNDQFSYKLCVFALAAIMVTILVTAMCQYFEN